MKTSILIFLLSFFSLISKSQENPFYKKNQIMIKINNFNIFEYPNEISLEEALLSNRVIYDTISYKCSKKYFFNLEKKLVTFYLESGSIKTYKILCFENLEKSLSVDVEVFNDLIFNCIFSKNTNNDLTMVVIKRLTNQKNNIDGFFSNKVEIIN